MHCGGARAGFPGRISDTTQNFVEKQLYGLIPVV